MANAPTAVNAAKTSNIFTVDNIAAKWINQEILYAFTYHHE